MSSVFEFFRRGNKKKAIKKSPHDNDAYEMNKYGFIVRVTGAVPGYRLRRLATAGWDWCESCYASRGPTHDGHPVYQELQKKIKTGHLADTVNAAFTCYATRPYLGVKRPVAASSSSSSDHEYHFFTYGEIHDRVRNFGRGLRHIMESEYGVRHRLSIARSDEDGHAKSDTVTRKEERSSKGKTNDKKKDKGKELSDGHRNASAKRDPSDTDAFVQQAVGLCSLNRVEWIVADFASLFLGYITEYIVNNSKLSVMVVGGPRAHTENDAKNEHELLRELLDFCIRCPTLKLVISMSDPDEEDVKRAQANGLKLMGFGEVEKLGADLRSNENAHSIQYVRRPGSDLYTLMYTSGSTGKPKGVMISYDGWNTALTTVGMPLDPLAHMSARKNVACTLVQGGRIGLFQSEMNLIFDDIMMVRPTLFSSTPRLWNILYTRYQEELSLQKKLKRDELGEDRELTAQEVRAIEEPLLQKYEKSIGGRARYIVSGGAPTSPAVLAFLQRCFSNSMVTNGYGSTEVGAIAHDRRVADSAEVKLVDVPEMGYFTTDQPNPRGEIYVKTKTMAQGYYNDPDATAAAFTEDGWFRSGDIGEMIGNKVIIIDRKKNIFKLAQGEFVAPEKLEVIYQECSVVDQVFVYGTTLREYLVAVVVPNLAVLREWAKDASVQDASLASALDDDEALCTHPKASSFVMQQLYSVGAKAGIQPFEYVRGVHLETKQFTLENGLLTGPQKLKRQALNEHYKETLDRLYDQLDDPTNMQKALLSMIGVDAHNEQITQEGKNLTLRNLGVDSLTAVRLAAQLKDQYRVDVSVQSLFQNVTVVDLAQIMMGSKEAAKKLQAGEAIDWSKEFVLDSDIKPKISFAEYVERHREDTAAIDSLYAPRAVLLTGATGFLGAFLLLEILRKLPSTTVYCLVRGEDAEQARSRLLSAVEGASVGLDEGHAPDPDRIQVVLGDLSREWLGLDEARFAELANEVQCIYHNGAIVNSILPYHALKQENVGSTDWLLRLACMSDKPVVFFYISTIGVLASAGPMAASLREDDAVPDLYLEKAGGYSQSKLVSEFKVKEARKRGLFALVFRPGRVWAHSRTGYANPKDFLVLALKGMAQLGVAPEVPQSNRHNLAPVDFVSEAIVGISIAALRDRTIDLLTSSTSAPSLLSLAFATSGLASASVLASASIASSSASSTPSSSSSASSTSSLAAKEVSTFHIISPLPSLPVAHIIDAIIASYPSGRIKVASYEQWLAAIRSADASNALQPLLPRFEATGGEFPKSSVDDFRKDNLMRYVSVEPTTRHDEANQINAKEVTLASTNVMIAWLQSKAVLPPID